MSWIQNLSFREKTAWVSLLTTVGVYTWYFAPLLTGAPPSGAGRLAFAIAALAALQTVPLIVLAALDPADAKTPADERETLFVLKGCRVAYGVLLAGALACCVGSLHFGLNGIWLGNGLLAAIVAGEIAKSAAQLLYYRRGA